MFWLTSPTNRVYHIAMDRLIGKKIYHLLEVEYCGLRGDQKNRQIESGEIIKKELEGLKNVITKKHGQRLRQTKRQKITMIKLFE